MILAPVQPVHQRPARLRHLPGAARVLARGPDRSTSPGCTSGSTTPTGVTSTTSSADTRQPEIDYQPRRRRGTPIQSTYQGTGGVQLKNFLVKAAFAIRFGDFNLLVSDLRHPAVAAHVRPRHHPDGAEGGTLPELRLRPLPGAVRGADLLGPRRLHHQRQLPLLAERRHVVAAAQQRVAARTSTTSATR